MLLFIASNVTMAQEASSGNKNTEAVSGNATKNQINNSASLSDPLGLNNNNNAIQIIIGRVIFLKNML